MHGYGAPVSEHAVQVLVDRGWARVAAMGGEFARMASAAGLPTVTVVHARVARLGEGTVPASPRVVEDARREGWVVGVGDDTHGAVTLLVLDDGRWAMAARRPTPDVPGAPDLPVLWPAGWDDLAACFSGWVPRHDLTEVAVDDLVGRVRQALAAALRH